ncbi:acetyl-CoA carboxylase biotin carboxyl carrier protein subunit [Alkalihalophilus pseudofirmus]|nr:acetyl-CoA carboxylase biotin carboxyl carrier protein subunit [Alkalihalophilus pseudofirmus]
MSKVLSSMAGNIWKLLVEVDDQVVVGQEIVILESMKMEIPITAEIEGTVKEIKVNEGDFVSEGEVIVELL